MASPLQRISSGLAGWSVSHPVSHFTHSTEVRPPVDRLGLLAEACLLSMPAKRKRSARPRPTPPGWAPARCLKRSRRAHTPLSDSVATPTLRERPRGAAAAYQGKAATTPEYLAARECLGRGEGRTMHCPPCQQMVVDGTYKERAFQTACSECERVCLKCGQLSTLTEYRGRHQHTALKNYCRTCREMDSDISKVTPPPTHPPYTHGQSSVSALPEPMK